MEVERMTQFKRIGSWFVGVVLAAGATACGGEGFLGLGAEDEDAGNRRGTGSTGGTGGTMTTGGSGSTGGNSAGGGISVGGASGATGGTSGTGTGGATGGSTAATGGSSGASAAAGGTGGSAVGTGGAGGSSGTASVTVREALPCFSDEGTPAGADLELALDANRLSGVAPLGVFFDTAGTTSTATDSPFLDLAYCWDFADPDSGSFTTTGLTRNQAKGPVASHVFEKPGTYNVTVSARDRQGRVATRAVEIQVDDPDTVFAGDATTCFSSSGDFTDCPEGAAQETITSFGELSSHLATGRRLLLRRGDTFAGDAKITINVPGPGSIGAYGTGDRPRIDLRSDAIVVSGREPQFSDWRIADLDFQGASAEAGILTVDGRATELTLLRIRAVNIGGGITAGGSIIDYWNANGFPGHDVIDGFFIQDSEFRDLVGGAGSTLAFIAAHRLVMLGTIWNNALGGEHVVRTTWVDRGVFSNNDMGEAPSGKHVWKLHAPDFNEASELSGGKYSERMVISDNVFRSTGPHDWTIAISPQNANTDERIRNVVFERNLFLPGPTAVVALIISATDVVIRDNIVNHARGRCFSVSRRGVEPSPARVSLVHNTCYSSGGGAIDFVDVDADLESVTAFNNLASSVGGSESNFPASELTEQTANQVLPPSIFAGSDFATDWNAFELTPGSAAIDVGLPEFVSAWDFSGRARSQDGDDSGSAEPDLGALELDP
jgi:hypothetical protein